MLNKKRTIISLLILILIRSRYNSIDIIRSHDSTFKSDKNDSLVHTKITIIFAETMNDKNMNILDT